MVMPKNANVGVIGLIVSIVGVGVLLLYNPFNQMELHDGAIYDYCAQTILRSKLPYRDVVDGKGPGSMYLSALGMLIGRFVGLRDIIAVRLLYILLTGLFLMIIFLVTNAYLRSRVTAIIASLAPLMVSSFVLLMIQGTQPKLPMMIFGMLSLLLIAKNRPFWAGFSSALSCLCWQPGLIFAGVAFLVFSHYFRSWRDLRALKTAVGATIPLLVVVLYFYSQNALADMWTWAVTFNYSVYAPITMNSDPIANIWTTISRTFETKVVFVVIGSSGFLLYLFQWIRTKVGNTNLPGSEAWFREAILIPPAVYLGFCLFHFQGDDDVIPLFPFIGIFIGYFFVEVGHLTSLLWPGSYSRVSAHYSKLIPVLALFVIVSLILASRRAYQTEPGQTLQDQYKEYQIVADALGPDDKIYVHGAVEILVLLDRPNLNQYIYFDRGKDEYVNAHTPGGFKSIIGNMESQGPKIVCLSRLRNTSYGWMLKEWAAEYYDPLPLPHFPHTFVHIRSQ